MKKIYGFIIGIILLGSAASRLQAQTDLTYTQEVDRQLQNVSKTPITTKVLYDRVFPFTRLDLFGQVTPDTADLEYYIQAYSELRRAAYTTTLKSAKTLKYRIKEISNTGTVPIGIIAYKFNLIDTLALKDNLLYQANGLYYDSSPRSRSPFKQKNHRIGSGANRNCKGKHSGAVPDYLRFSRRESDRGYQLYRHRPGQWSRHVYGRSAVQPYFFGLRAANDQIRGEAFQRRILYYLLYC